MDINASKKFMDDNREQIMRLFMYYQMIESLLFIKLYLPDISATKDRDNFLTKINKENNSKTLGKIKNKYLSKFPKDEYDLKSRIEVVGKERNSFMHSFWIFLVIAEDKDRINVGKKLLNQYEKNAIELYDKIHEIPNKNS